MRHSNTRPRAETVGSLYRGLCTVEAPRDTGQERLNLLESLGFVHRRRPRPQPMRDLGICARRRAVPPVRSLGDGFRAAQAARDRRRGLKFTDAMSASLQKISRLQIKDEAVPALLWCELDRVQRHPVYIGDPAPPGPGQYLRSPAPQGRTTTFRPPVARANDTLRRPDLEAPSPGPGQYLPQLRDHLRTAPAFHFNLSGSASLRNAEARRRDLRARHRPPTQDPCSAEDRRRARDAAVHGAIEHQKQLLDFEPF